MSRFMLAGVSFWVGVAAAMASAADLSPKTERPDGAYSTAWLTLEKAAPGGADLPLFLALRDGKAATAWFCHPAFTGLQRMWVDSSTVAADGASLKGELKGRAVLGADRGGSARDGTRDFTLTLDATVEGGAAKGTCSLTISGTPGKGAPASVSGKLGGTLRSGKETGSDALPADKAWAGYYGTAGCLRGPDCGAKLVDDLAKARPVWKSEAVVPVAYGSAPDMRYPDRGGYVGVGGGASTPVVSGGLVFLYHYRPSPDAPFPEQTFAGKDMAARREEAKTLLAREIERTWYLDLFRAAADDVLIAVDAATGRTVWRTAFPMRSANVQTHKMRWLSPVPTVHEGVVYCAGFSGRLYALEAATGKPLWEYPPQPEAFDKAFARQEPCAVQTPCPVIAGGVLVHSVRGEMAGLDPKTGSVRWKAKSPVGVIHRWTHEGRDRLLVAVPLTAAEKKAAAAKAAEKDKQPTDKGKDKDDEDGSSGVAIHCVDPADGKTLWKTETEFLHYSYLPLLSGDLLLGYNFGRWDANAVSGGRVLAYRVKPDGLEKAWQTPLPKGTDSYGLTCTATHVFASAEDRMLCIDLSDGKVAGTVEGVGGRRTQLAFNADGRVFLQPEGRHGKQAFLMVDADPKNLRILGGGTKPTGSAVFPGWRPPHPWTTAYANQPIGYPVVDGRIFIRGGDALYCYDLRATGK
jgi:outer membrane protein assembly factor BamB